MRYTFIFLCAILTQGAGPSSPPRAITSNNKPSGAARKLTTRKPAAKAKKTAVTAPAGLPMRLTPRAPVKSVMELADPLDKVVPNVGRNQPALTLTNGEGQEVEVRTCREYYDRTAEGFFAMSTAEMVAASFFVQNCDTRCILAGAWRSRKSHVRDFILDAQSARKLPLSIIPDDLNPDHPSNKSKGNIRVDANPRTKFRDSSPYCVEIETESYIVFVEQIAWADFDHDGNEDILFFLYTHVNGGTMQWPDHVAVTRRSDKSPLKEIPLNYVRKAGAP